MRVTFLEGIPFLSAGEFTSIAEARTNAGVCRVTAGFLPRSWFHHSRSTCRAETGVSYLSWALASAPSFSVQECVSCKEDQDPVIKA